MTHKDRIDPVITPPQRPDEEHAEVDGRFTPSDNARDRPARPDPETGEVPAGPGDAGLEGRPEVNAGSPGTRQMSNRRMGIGLGIAALLAVLVFVLAAIF